MTDMANNAYTRRGAFRRGSLLALGAAGIATALAAPGQGKAKKGKQDRCRKNQGQCRAAVEDYCTRNTNDPPACVSLYGPCCDQFTGCNVGAGISCILRAD
jgi:hypothetical protein